MKVQYHSLSYGKPEYLIQPAAYLGGNVERTSRFIAQ